MARLQFHRRGNDFPRLILIFVAAKKNGSPAVHPQRQPKSRLRLVSCCSDSGFHGVNLGITAGFCLFTPSFVRRFLISGSNLRIDAGFSRFTLCCVHRFLISSPDLLIDARGEWFRLQQLLRQRCSASDSILCSRKEEWFRLQRLSRQRGPCPILIFVAAKKNGPPAAAVAATIFRI